MIHLMFGPNLLSCKSDMTQITPLTIIAFTFGAISAAQPLGFIADILNLGGPKLAWKRVDQGNIPRDAIKLRPFSSLVHHYCRVTQTGETHYYGYLASDQAHCRYTPDIDTKTVELSSTFDVLVGDDRKASLEYVGSRVSAEQMKRRDAVPCDLDMDTASDCYFGAGIYSDGICSENLGVIVPSLGRVFMPDEEKASVCGVYLALVYN